MERKTLKLLNRPEWILTRRPDARIERTKGPVILNLKQALGWIKKQRPLIWLGSIFSVPESSGFPSGVALTKSLLELIFTNMMPEERRDQLINTLLPRWPLEALLDEFEFVDFDLSESLLHFFKGVNDTALPNALHHAVTSYYQRGLAGKPLCVTTNWDTLQEKAFRQAGYTVVIGSPGEMPTKEFGREGSDPKIVFVYHPHGSFETRDVVCSFKQEQRQLSLHTEFMWHPTLFLGYSGYEPSLYRNLEYTTGQLWCIRDRSELEIPAKRRLLCRPNTFVYIGDIRKLLRGLSILKDEVDLTSKYVQLASPNIPPKVIEVVHLGILASLEPGFCVSTLIDTLLSFLDEPEATIRFVVLMRALVNHIRNRMFHPGILPALMAAARFRDSEQIWISTLAYLLRTNTNLESKIIKKILEYSEEASKRAGESGSSEDAGVYMPGVLLKRSEIYKSYVRQINKIDDVRIYTYPPLVGSDMGASGEFIEILAFEYLREGKNELARNCFDYAATSFYLRGLWNSGQLNEWAAKNIKRLVGISKENSLMIPVEQTK